MRVSATAFALETNQRHSRLGTDKARQLQNTQLLIGR